MRESEHTTAQHDREPTGSGPPADAAERGRGPAGIARALRDIARLLELTGDQPFRAKAYERGARVVERLSAPDLARLIAERRLTDLVGIGRALANVIGELNATGRAGVLDDLKSRVPPGALELSRVPHLGLAKIAALGAALGIETIAALKAACEAGRVRAVKGFGERTERRILDAIRELERPVAARALLPSALAVAEPLLAHVRQDASVAAADIAGDLRRWAETVDRVVIVVAATSAAAAIEHALASPLVASVGTREATTCHASLITGLPLELRVTTPERYPVELLYATGTPAHVTRLEQVSRARGLSLTPAGRSASARGRRRGLQDERDIYRRLGVDYIAPELREDTGEVEAALAGQLPAELVTPADIRGLVHCHTVYSDGKHTVAQMARAADALGMEYLTITDHSPTASYAGGLGVDRLRAQWDEIARVQETVSVRLLRGTESDILADGALDYPDEILEQLDVVIASIHSRMRMDADQMTRRLVRAMQQPCFKIWGHALGRLVLSRPPIACRVEEVLDAAAASRAAVEVNGDPRRLDLEPRWLRAARERGIRFVISTDAHSVGELSSLRYGVAMARRGWVSRGEVLNALGADGFARAVRPAGG